MTATSDTEAFFQRKEIHRTTRHLVEQASALAETFSELNSGDELFHEPPEARFGPRPKTFDPLIEIRSNLSFRSSSFRHALRLGVASAIGGLLAASEHLVRGYWIPMTVVIVLKPNFGGTLQRSVQRITGTVLGALRGSAAGAGFAGTVGTLGGFASPGFCYVCSEEFQLHSVCPLTHSDRLVDARYCASDYRHR